MDLILGRMTLLLGKEKNETYILENPLNMTIVLIHTTFKVIDIYYPERFFFEEKCLSYSTWKNSNISLNFSRKDL